MPSSRRDIVLIFRLGSIGDTVVALPCFHAIAQAYPAHRRVLLTNSPTSARASSAESVMDGSGLIDGVIYYPAGNFSIRKALAMRREIRRLRPVELIYLADRPTAAPVIRDVAFFKAAGIAKIVGGPWNQDLRSCRTDPLTGETEYEADRLARTLHDVARVDLSPAGWNLCLTDLEHAKVNALIRGVGASRTLIAVAPGAKIPDKDWGADNWAALLASLADDYHDKVLVLVGAQDERALCDGLARRWTGSVLNLCGTLTPRETAAVLARCKLLICHDSGPMHLAASQGTPCVALFGNYNRPRRWYPYGRGHCVVHEPRGIRQIDVQRAVVAVRSTLSEPPAAACRANEQA